MRLGALLANIEHQRLGLLDAIALERHILRRQNFALGAHGQLALAAGEPVILERHRCCKTRFGQRARRHHCVLDLDIFGWMLASEADGMDWNPLPPDGRDGVQIDAARVIGAIAQQHNRAQGQGRGFRHHAFQRIADARGLLVGVQGVGALDALGLFAELIKPHLKFFA
jgi:hypothetical protein